MSKHETSNQFNNGLIMDVHPLQTPNTVLTDCLNGTFITYNGNEHVLQNDMGNYKLEKCKLRENFIPVGTASYGDILYIASYNPIDGEFELGSYPSILQWGSSDGDSNKTLHSIIDQAKEHVNRNTPPDNEPDYTFLFSSLTKQPISIVFDEDALKLEPGDKYKIEVDNESKEESIEAHKFFVLDSNSVKHYFEPERDGNFHHITWQIPGYIGVEKKILSPYEHKLTLKSANVKDNSVVFTFISRLYLMDSQLIEKIDKIKENFNFEIQCNQVENKVPFLSSAEKSIFTWLVDKKQMVTEFSVKIDYKNPPLNDNGLINEINTKFTILPIYEGDDYIIKYDNLQQDFDYTVNGKNITRVAEDTFYWVEGDDATHILYFDVFKNEGDSIYYQIFDVRSCLEQKIETTFENVIENDSYINLDGLDENNLYLIVFKINSAEKTTYIGRFICLNKSVSTGRADLEISFQDELNKIREEWKNTTFEIQEEEDSSEYISDNDIFNKLSLYDENFCIEDILIEDDWLNHTTFTSTKKITSIGQNLNASFFEEPIIFENKFTLDNNKDKDFEGTTNIKNLDFREKFTYNVEVSKEINKKICFKEILNVKKYITNVIPISWKQDACCTTAAYLYHGAEMIDYFDGDRSSSRLLKDCIQKNYSFKPLLDFEVSRSCGCGGGYRMVKDNKNWVSVESGVKSSKSKLFMLCYDETYKFIPVRFEGIDSFVGNNKNEFATLSFKKNSDWVMKWLYRMGSLGLNPNISMRTLYGTTKFNCNDILIKWMLDGSNINDLQQTFEGINVEFDPDSKIEKLNNGFLDWIEIKIPHSSVPSTETLEKTIDKWNECVTQILSKYEEYKAYYNQIETLFNTIQLDSRTPNTLYTYADSPNVIIDTFNIYPLFLVTGGFIPLWDSQFAAYCGYDTQTSSFQFVVTANGKRKTKTDKINIYSYD